jgi:hypothetical protein
MPTSDAEQFPRSVCYRTSGPIRAWYCGAGEEKLNTVYGNEHSVREDGMAEFPWYVWSLVLVGVVGIALLTAVGLYRVGSARVAIGFAVLWSAWIVTTAVLADRGAYRQVPDANRPWIGVATGGILLALFASMAIPAVRRALTGPPGLAAMTWPQTVRVVGVVFLIAMALGTLPAVFALPAGLGDLAVGIAAPFVARRLVRGDRSGAVWFNVLGLIDLVVAVSLGSLAALGPSRILAVSPSTADIALLPLVLIPTAAVPLAFALHVISLARLRRAPVTTAGTSAVPAHRAGVAA